MINKIWKDPVWSKVIAAGILALIASVSAYFLGAWPSIKAILSQAWSFVLSSTSVPNWLLGIMMVPCLLLGYVLLIGLKEWLAGGESGVSFKNYTKDNFFGLLWMWRYSGNGIDNLHSLCPRCQYQILPKDASFYAAVPRYDYICDDCGYSAGSIEGDPEELHQKVELKIQKALRTGEWAEKKNA
jgi:hypothetical protein